MKRIINYFTKQELILWTLSFLLIIVSFVIWDRVNYLNLISSLLGATSLIFIAKGNPVGQLLTVLFGILYGIISYFFAYYGEMITYLGMTVPMAILSFITWVKNPSKKGKSEVKIKELEIKECVLMIILTALVTVIFYFILKALNTSNLIPSTISITTSFAAVFLTLRRSRFYALAYALNDIVLIVLWILASIKDVSYMSVTTCFIVFLFNDIYGFINWTRMKKRQTEISNK